jgi:hypothetical protein
MSAPTQASAFGLAGFSAPASLVSELPVPVPSSGLASDDWSLGVVGFLAPPPQAGAARRERG